MTIGYTGDLPADLWNPPPPEFRQFHQDLSKAIDRELANLPIRQQTVIVATLWDVDCWSVDILTEAPTDGRYDGVAECLVDFDQYYGTVSELRRYAAEELASDLMEQAIPDWRHLREFGPAWDADPPDLN